MLGFLGPNGAGKSTTMRMITGFIPPSEGTITVGGFDVVAEPIAARQLIGYLPENAPSYADMTVLAFLGFCAEMRGMRGDRKKRAVRRVVEACFLEPVIHQTIETLSKGYRHRTCFAQSIIHDPEVLILDEPTDGLDPNQKHEVRTLIRTMGQRKAIIFSTHILEEVEAVCSRAIIIDHGRVVANGTPADLKQRSTQAGAVTLRLRPRDEALAPEGVLRKIEGLRGIETALLLGEKPLTIRITPELKKPDAGGAEMARALYALAVAEKWDLEELHTEEGRLDEVFRSITLGDHAPATETRKEAA
ncbi:MAG TPA: ATP-binding cassette domain-containing protein [Chthoniobacteraceae bacterium]|nr:ATP-binding cassette domain-containing protein [Chthoniobacteraceae bacterium]